MAFRRLLHLFVKDESAQGITEYGAVIAMVAIVVAVAFSLTSGQLTSGILAAYSAITTQLNNLSSTGGTASGG
jgi:Flp pilus assembly pilin Flp